MQTTPPQDERLAAAWRDHRQYVLDVAYRMLGSVTEAEDVVQETFARLFRAEDEIADVRGWLVVVATRLCLDQLRSARAKREAYVGPWLPEPVGESAGGESLRAVGPAGGCCGKCNAGRLNEAFWSEPKRSAAFRGGFPVGGAPRARSSRRQG